MDQEMVPIVPTEGVVIHEETCSFVLCKPKLLPMKSVTIEKLEKMQQEAYEKATRMTATSHGREANDRSSSQ